MPFIVWNDRLSVGVAGIDHDHRRLVEILNDLYEAMGNGRNKQILGQLLDELVDYACYHFEREEGMFRADYGEALDHKAEHENFVAWITETQSRFMEGSAAAPSLEVVNYLKDWLFDHILGRDRRLGAHLNELGFH
jgi:hemerythrin